LYGGAGYDRLQFVYEIQRPTLRTSPV
jgi:hypothetical protein